jgi:hypothetical protein
MVAYNQSRLVFDFNASDIPTMSLERAINARKRILTKIPDLTCTIRRATW